MSLGLGSASIRMLCVVFWRAPGLWSVILVLTCQCMALSKVQEAFTGWCIYQKFGILPQGLWEALDIYICPLFVSNITPGIGPVISHGIRGWRVIVKRWQRDHKPLCILPRVPPLVSGCKAHSSGLGHAFQAWPTDSVAPSEGLLSSSPTGMFSLCL